MNYWIKRITPKNEICKAENGKTFSHSESQRKILSLYDLSGPFILLVTGSFLSLFVFLVEKIYYYHKLITNLSVRPSVKVREINPYLASTGPIIGIIDELSLDGDKQGHSLNEGTDKVENFSATGGADSQNELKTEQGEYSELLYELMYTYLV